MILDDTIATGYVSNLSMVSPSKDRKRKYFHFTLQTEKDAKRVVCFSPEKHRLIAKINKEKQGCEIKKFRLNDKDEIMVGDYSSVKQQSLPFPQTEIERKLTQISTILNETGLFEVVNVRGFIHNLTAIESVDRNGENLKLRKGIITDETGSMPITFFADATDKVRDHAGFLISDVRVSKYMCERLLKCTATSVLTEDTNIKFDEEDLTHTTKATLKGKIIGLCLATLDKKYTCSNCNEPVEVDDEMYICSACSNMATIDDATSKNSVSLTILADGKKHCLFVAKDLLVATFKESEKLKLAKKMLAAKVELEYTIADDKIFSFKKLDV